MPAATATSAQSAKRPMQLDLFYELSCPPGLARSEADTFHETLEELVEADRLGFGTAWLVEHHFMPGYSHSAAPDAVLAACAAQTKRLGLGLGIVPLPYHHPLHVAERVATLDVLARGRVEFGYGRGFSPKEYAAFGVAMGDSRRLTDHALEIVLEAWTGASIERADGPWPFGPLEVVPRPVQRPHPPIWSAAVSPESFERAAERGHGVLAGPFKPWFMVREDIKRYHEAWDRHHQGDAHTAVPRAGMTVGILCLEDGRRARRLASEGIVWFYRHLLDQTRPVLERLYEGYEYYRRFGPFRWLMAHGLSLSVLERLGMVVVGTPQHCRERLEAIGASGVNRVLCAVGAGTLETGLVRESMALLAEEVLPALSGPASQGADLAEVTAPQRRATPV